MSQGDDSGMDMLNGVIDVEEQAYDPAIPLYEHAFPSLEPSHSPYDLPPSSPPGGASQARLLRIAPFKSTMKTEAFQIPLEERRFTPDLDESQRQQQSASGNTTTFSGNWETKTRNCCTEVARRCRVAVEFNATRMGALKVFVTGREANVMEAKRMLLRQLQTQCMIQISIPKEHHRALLGAKGVHIQEMELLTSSKIKFPNPDDVNNTIITILGTKEGAEHARQLLQSRSDELAKLGLERITLPKKFHQLVCHKTNNAALHTLVEKGLVRLAIPPFSVMKDEIVVSGEKDAVKAAVQFIQIKYKEMERDCQNFSIELPKEKHKYIIGAKGVGIAEIFDETGVMVNLPPAESESNSVNFFGPAKQLGEALTRVFAKSTSIKLVQIPAPTWLHRFIIGRKGATLEPLMKDKENTHLSFDGATDEIRLEGPPAEVDELAASLRELVADLQNRMAFEVLNVDPSLHKHIVGKEGSNLRKLRDATGVSITLPSEAQGRIVRIEGSPEGVAKAKLDIMQMLQKIENTKAKDMIIDHKLIPRLIGQHGKTIREFREKYPSVVVNFPKPDSDSNIVVLRGPRDEVDNAAKALKKLYQEIAESNYSESVYVPKNFHRNIIGKVGATIREIRENTNCKISLPDSTANSELIVVTGTQKDVTKAVHMIQDIYHTQSNLVELSLEAPAFLHTRLIGKQGQHVLELQQEFDNKVQIRFPNIRSHSNVVMIRGPREEATAARERLAKIVMELSDKYHQEDVRAPAKCHRFIVGVKSINMQRIRDATGVRIIFPDTGTGAGEETGGADTANGYNHQDLDCIRLLGPKKDVEKAKEMLQEIIDNLGEIVSEIVHVDAKWRSHFNRRRGDELGRLSSLCCARMELATTNTGVSGRPPPAEATAPGSTFAVRIEGPRENVELAKQKLQEAVYTLEHSVTEDILISLKHKQSLLGACRRQVEKLAVTHNVHIHVADSPTVDGPSPTGAEDNNGLLPNGGDSAIHSDGSISNAGRSSGMASSDKDDRSPVSESRGKTLTNGDDHSSNVSETSSDLPVNITEKSLKTLKSANSPGRGDSIPEVETEPQFKVTLAGLREEVAKVRSALMDLCPVEKEIPVECDFHSAVIGAGGKKVQELREKYGVNILVPVPRLKHPFISIIGLKDAVASAAMEVEDFVDRLKQERDDRIARNYTTVARVPTSFHSFIIGSKGSNIASLRERFGVIISVPLAKEQKDEILIRGYKDKADAASREILQMVAKLESYVTATLSIPPRVHPLLIGARGANLSRIRREYDVEIAFPSRAAMPGVEAETVTITGTQEKVDLCSDYLINTANEMLMEIEEREAERSRPGPGPRRPYPSMNPTATTTRMVNQPGRSVVSQNSPPQPPPPPPVAAFPQMKNAGSLPAPLPPPPPPPPPPTSSKANGDTTSLAVVPPGPAAPTMNGGLSWSQKVKQSAISHPQQPRK